MMSELHIACIQLKVVENKQENLSQISTKIREAAQNGAELICLPEFFNSLYGLRHFQQNGEEIPSGETSILLSKMARELQVFIIGGSMCERKNETFFNTCPIWDNKGNLIETYRKLHLPDIEGEFFKAGNTLSMIEIGKFRIGIGICFDIRFEELAKLYRKMNCNFLVYPVAFSLTSGPMHAEILAKSRALDNQCFTAIICPARNDSAEFVTWGNSCVIDPSGQCITRANENEGILYANLNLREVEKARTKLPIFDQRRVDIYENIDKNMS